MSQNFYNSMQKITFTSISERLPVPKAVKAKQSKAHSALITYVVDHFQDTNKYKRQVVKALNTITYCILSNEIPPFNWTSSNPFETMPEYDDELIEQVVGSLMLDVDCIDWDIKPTDTITRDVPAPVVATSQHKEVKKPQPKKEKKESNKPQVAVKPGPAVFESVTRPPVGPTVTAKEDLYIQAPKYPEFDYSRPWLSVMDGDDKLVIYRTLPEIPTRQNEISVTTEVARMTDAELMHLYPDQFVRTRSPILYEKVNGLPYDDQLGVIFPISNFKKEEIIDNIIKYPHLYKLKREVDGEIISFYDDIEIDGELLSIANVWDTLPEAKYIPRQSDYIKEYVVRRYLLERDHGVQHKYPMYGSLDPYLTLFMPPSDYVDRGYKDVLQIVKDCVNSRVRFKTTRNPILKRLNLA